jgi:hypothetical protein
MLPLAGYRCGLYFIYFEIKWLIGLVIIRLIISLSAVLCIDSVDDMAPSDGDTSTTQEPLPKVRATAIVKCM